MPIKRDTHTKTYILIFNIAVKINCTPITYLCNTMTESALQRLKTLAAAAKYDVSCSSSGTVRRNNGAGVGNTVGGIGICHSFAADGTEQSKAVTYHNLTDRWYLILPESWDNRFTVRQTSSGSVRATTFFAIWDQSIGEELLTIYTLTGTDREAQAAKSGRSILRRRSGADTVYAVSFAEGYDQWPWSVEREALAERFNVIVNRWSMGEN